MTTPAFGYQETCLPVDDWLSQRLLGAGVHGPEKEALVQAAREEFKTVYRDLLDELLEQARKAAPAAPVPVDGAESVIAAWEAFEERDGEIAGAVLDATRRRIPRELGDMDEAVKRAYAVLTPADRVRSVVDQAALLSSQVLGGTRYPGRGGAPVVQAPGWVWAPGHGQGVSVDAVSPGMAEAAHSVATVGQRLVNVEGDGDCLFSAFVVAAELRDEYGRLRTSGWLRQHLASRLEGVIHQPLDIWADLGMQTLGARFELVRAVRTPGHWDSDHGDAFPYLLTWAHDVTLEYFPFETGRDAEDWEEYGAGRRRVSLVRFNPGEGWQHWAAAVPGDAPVLRETTAPGRERGQSSAGSYTGRASRSTSRSAPAAGGYERAGSLFSDVSRASTAYGGGMQIDHAGPAFDFDQDDRMTVDAAQAAERALTPRTQPRRPVREHTVIDVDDRLQESLWKLGDRARHPWHGESERIPYDFRRSGTQNLQPEQEAHLFAVLRAERGANLARGVDETVGGVLRRIQAMYGGIVLDAMDLLRLRQRYHDQLQVQAHRPPQPQPQPQVPQPQLPQPQASQPRVGLLDGVPALEAVRALAAAEYVRNNNGSVKGITQSKMTRLADGRDLGRALGSWVEMVRRGRPPVAAGTREFLESLGVVKPDGGTKARPDLPQPPSAETLEGVNLSERLLALAAKEYVESTGKVRGITGSKVRRNIEGRGWTAELGTWIKNIRAGYSIDARTRAFLRGLGVIAGAEVDEQAVPVRPEPPRGEPLGPEALEGVKPSERLRALAAAEYVSTGGTAITRTEIREYRGEDLGTKLGSWVNAVRVKRVNIDPRTRRYLESWGVLSRTQAEAVPGPSASAETAPVTQPPADEPRPILYASGIRAHVLDVLRERGASTAISERVIAGAYARIPSELRSPDPRRAARDIVDILQFGRVTRLPGGTRPAGIGDQSSGSGQQESVRVPLGARVTVGLPRTGSAGVILADPAAVVGADHTAGQGALSTKDGKQALSQPLSWTRFHVSDPHRLHALFGYDVSDAGDIRFGDGDGTVHLSANDWMAYGDDFLHLADGVVLRGDSGWIGRVDNWDALTDSLGGTGTEATHSVLTDGRAIHVLPLGGATGPAVRLPLVPEGASAGRDAAPTVPDAPAVEVRISTPRIVDAEAIAAEETRGVEALAVEEAVSAVSAPNDGPTLKAFLDAPPSLDGQVAGPGVRVGGGTAAAEPSSGTESRPTPTDVDGRQEAVAGVPEPVHELSAPVVHPEPEADPPAVEEVARASSLAEDVGDLLASLNEDVRLAVRTWDRPVDVEVEALAGILKGMGSRSLVFGTSADGPVWAINLGGTVQWFTHDFGPLPVPQPADGLFASIDIDHHGQLTGPAARALLEAGSPQGSGTKTGFCDLNVGVDLSTVLGRRPR
ncbi:hypothetical protein OG206_22885 [Streptomyces sp. NBC_01341]|uniref:OTU domain-containing protein n=1 Tax=Streptomyces sp. NBC_01341 TaxID=2903831 RepID=UPI002E0F1C98|nr:hypothetical protein OG206_22885 [Streptomyces sp. NBC_01341]